jgi:ribonuclease HI
VDEHGNPGAAAWVKATNNVAELTGIREALAAHPDVELLIESDSQYAINAITVWGPGWRANPEDADGKKNLGLVYSILDLLETRREPVEFVWVRGHDVTNAHPLNTAADALASRYAKKRTNLERETGTTTIDWERKTAPAPSRWLGKMPTWATQSQMGKVLGLSAIEVGRALKAAGLRDGMEPTEKAIETDMVQERKMKSGAVFYVWRADLVLPLLDADKDAA